MGAETKTIGQLCDELSIVNIRIWMLIDKVMDGTASVAQAQLVQVHNAQRNELIRGIDRLLGQRDIGAKVYAS